MAVSLATVRYVRALFALASERGEGDRLRDEVARLGALLAESPELAQLLRNPRADAASKKKVLDEVGLAGALQTLRDFVGLCLDRGRPEVVLEVAEEYARLDREARGIVVARIQSAARLDDAMRASLTAKLEEVTGKKVDLEEEVQPHLLGGVRILFGSTMYDGSVRRRLEDVASHLESVRIA